MPKKTIPPCRCSLPVRYPGSTRVPSIAIVKIRKPFLAIERRTASPITKAFRDGERRQSWAKTMVVTSNIELDRILLHS